MLRYKPYDCLVMTLLACVLGCQQSSQKALRANENGLAYHDPAVYIVDTLSNSPLLDGRISDEEWAYIPWSDPLVPLIKNGMSPIADNTRFKLGTRGDSLYLCAIIPDKHIWAVNDICQSYFFDDNFLSFYLDANKNKKDYLVLKINALGNFCGEYRYSNNHQAALKFSLQEMALGRCAVFVEGTLNNPKDTDEYWSVECAIPLHLHMDNIELLGPYQSWNVNVQRTHWPFVIVAGLYKKMLNPHTGRKYAGEKWVWSYGNEDDIDVSKRWGKWRFGSPQVIETTVEN